MKVAKPSNCARRGAAGRSSSGRHARGGVIVAAVLVCLLVASMLGLSLIRTMLVYHRQMQAAASNQQCFWLAEAAVERAERRLADDPDYEGETWTVGSDVLGGSQPAAATIEVIRDSQSSEPSKIRVEARYPDVPIQRTVCRRELTLTSK